MTTGKTQQVINQAAGWKVHLPKLRQDPGPDSKQSISTWPLHWDILGQWDCQSLVANLHPGGLRPRMCREVASIATEAKAGALWGPFVFHTCQGVQKLFAFCERLSTIGGLAKIFIPQVFSDEAFRKGITRTCCELPLCFSEGMAFLLPSFLSQWLLKVLLGG